LGHELLKYVKERKVRHKWIKEIEFTDMIPKSASGKILRRVLRDKSRVSETGTVVKDEVAAKAML
jgi:4-coumarate--CoA ligase